VTELPAPTIRPIVRAALAEDIGPADITTESTIPARVRARATIIAKTTAIVAGLPLVEAVFAELDPTVRFTPLLHDGDRANPGDHICAITSSARAILSGERTALNFLQRLSGIATFTRAFVEAVAGTKAKILDTRKTTPTLRALEKYAVAVGGGHNHRMGLFDAIMIKDNHRLLLARTGPGALADAVANARKLHPNAPITIEADSLEQVREALAAGADRILLDNMTPEQLREAVTLIAGRAKTEASGGITLANVAEIAATGVDYISVGALTHSAPAANFSLEIAQVENQ
jgi:nicotinate-nucleotide pyrophosphorylase (carboxylating)